MWCCRYLLVMFFSIILSYFLCKGHKSISVLYSAIQLGKEISLGGDLPYQEMVLKKILLKKFLFKRVVYQPGAEDKEMLLVQFLLMAER